MTWYSKHMSSIKDSATLKSFSKACPLHLLTCHCHSSSIRTCQRCSHSRRASTACSSGTHEPVMIRVRCEGATLRLTHALWKIFITTELYLLIKYDINLHISRLRAYHIIKRLITMEQTSSYTKRQQNHIHGASWWPLCEITRNDSEKGVATLKKKKSVFASFSSISIVFISKLNYNRVSTLRINACWPVSDNSVLICATNLTPHVVIVHQFGTLTW